MDEETEENMRLRFLAIEKKVSELILNQHNRKDIYKLEAEIAELNSKLLSTKFHIKEARELLADTERLHETGQRNFRFGSSYAG